MRVAQMTRQAGQLEAKVEGGEAVVRRDEAARARPACLGPRAGRSRSLLWRLAYELVLDANLSHSLRAHAEFVLGDLLELFAACLVGFHQVASRARLSSARPVSGGASRPARR